MSVKNVTLNDLGNVLSTPFMMSNSKDLIKAGWKGDIENFSKKLLKYSWPRTRDYTMAVIMLTVVVAARKAKDVTVKAKERDDKGTKGENDVEISLAGYINQKVSRNKIKELFDKIVSIESSSDSNNIAQSISKETKPLGGWFAKCFINLLLVSKNDPEKAKTVFENFLKQVKKMTKWKINRSYIKELTEVINKALNINITEPILKPEKEPEPENEPDPKQDTEEEIAQENLEFKNVLKLCAKSTKNHAEHQIDIMDVSRAQDTAIRKVMEQCEISGSPFFEPPKEDKFLQYLFNLVPIGAR